MRYIENSPLFWLDRVTTPLLHDAQRRRRRGAVVPGHRVVRRLRRLGKEVYLINYNNDVHNPAKRANQKDIAMRMQQFFDNKLKGSRRRTGWCTAFRSAEGKDQLATSCARRRRDHCQPSRSGSGREGTPTA